MAEQLGICHPDIKMYICIGRLLLCGFLEPSVSSQARRRSLYNAGTNPVYCVPGPTAWPCLDRSLRHLFPWLGGLVDAVLDHPYMDGCQRPPVCEIYDHPDSPDNHDAGCHTASELPLGGVNHSHPNADDLLNDLHTHL